jgi:hypothetical protein
MAYKATTTPTTTPTGVAGLKVECSCPTCAGRAAVIRHTDNKINVTKAHNLIRVAYGPFARSASTRANGPWAA